MRHKALATGRINLKGKSDEEILQFMKESKRPRGTEEKGVTAPVMRESIWASRRL